MTPQAKPPHLQLQLTLLIQPPAALSPAQHQALARALADLLLGAAADSHRPPLSPGGADDDEAHS